MLKPLSVCAAFLGSLGPLAACASSDAADRPIENVVVTADADVPRPPFRFTPEDEALLDEIQRGAFNYLWNHVSAANGMVFDRTDSPVISIGGVGFQLSGICVGVERGWITRAQGEERALRILRALEANPRNRVHGLFLHFLDKDDAGPTHEGYEHVVSTVDSALFFAGALTAGAFFGGEVAEIADRLFAGADWSAFLAPDSAPAHERGFISLGWKETGVTEDGPVGELLPFYWIDAGDEQLLTTFLAVAAPSEEFRVDPRTYYRLRRRLGAHGDIGPFSWFPWSGALFTSIFSHCWIDHARFGPDDPKASGVDHRPRIDWWANARMSVQMHRSKAMENPLELPTLGPNAWGLTACNYPKGYLVPSLFPDDVPMPGARAELDYSTYDPQEHWGDGTVATYGAGMAVLFDPEHAVAALRHYRALAARIPGMWDDPAKGGYGLVDSYNEGVNGQPWVSPLHFAIDSGPMLLTIENARTGAVSRWFHRHGAVRAACERLGLE